MPASIQLKSFLAKYSPEIAAQLQEARRFLVKLVPKGFELIYDNYNALAIGYGPTDKASDTVVSIAGYPKWVTLFFLHGAGLEDPNNLLEGNGARVRSIRLAPPSVLDTAPVRALLRQALGKSSEQFKSAPRLKTIVKSVSSKQRPRRPPTSRAIMRKK